MRSIRSRFVMLSLVSTLLCMALSSGMSLWSFSRSQTQSSDQILALTCQQQANMLNQELLGIEGSVDACAEITVSSLEALGDMSDDDAFERSMQDLQRHVRSIAQNTAGVSTFYVRVARVPGEEPDGFFYTRQGIMRTLIEVPVTPILDYDPDDVEHVGWYYQPAEAGRPIWMEPYYNQNINVYMTSYVSPLFVNGTFVGVVGMDVNLTVIIDAIRSIRPYHTGYAFLSSKEGLLYYHPHADAGESLISRAPELKRLVDTLQEVDEVTEGEVVPYTLDGSPKKLAYCTLRNGMLLSLTAETAEINAPVNELLRTVALIALVFSSLTVAFVINFADRITKPLLQLSHVADRIAQGDLDIELPAAGNDEVGVLTRSLDVTVQSLRDYISGINAKAYRDSLTMVKNKAAYTDTASDLQERMDGGGAEFGLVMLDVNYLKVINDQYGHAHGDDYLRTCCQMICHVFQHSPVYRVGGDEFVVLLEHDDLRDRDTLLAELDRRMEESAREDDPWKRVSLAKGMSVCQADDTRVDDVLHRADQAMYEDKRRMKAGR